MKYRNFLFVVYVCLICIFLYLECVTYTGNPSLFFRIIGAVADSSIYILPFLFLNKKWSILFCILIPMVALIILANILFYRNFNDLIPASSYFNSSIKDNMVIDGALSSLQASDFILIISIFPLLLYPLITKSYKLSTISKFDKNIWITICVLSLLTCFIGAIRRERIYNPDLKLTETICEVFPEYTVNWNKYYNNCNFTGYVFKCLLQSFAINKKLSNDEILLVKTYIEYPNKNYNQSCCKTSKKNIIFIVVESLQSNVLKLLEGNKAISTLDSLKSDSATIYIEKCKVLAGIGRSSDAQFMFNTGLLPLRYEPLVTNYALKNYPSLAKALDYNSIEVIGEDKSLWSHGLTNRSYGYSMLIDKVASSGQNQDSIIFRKAFEIFKNFDSPKFAFITTLTMHDPYNEIKVSKKLNNLNNYNDETREYIERLNHFDKSLSNFLLSLKIENIFSNSIIIITGDHEIRHGSNLNFPDDNNVPLFILNSDRYSYRKNNISQIDIFPTVLDLLDVYQYKFFGVNYRGIGCSIFQQYNSSFDINKAYEVSELLITRQIDIKK